MQHADKCTSNHRDSESGELNAATSDDGRPPLSRYLARRAAERGFTVRSLTQRLRSAPKNAASRATVGRWLAGEAVPGSLEVRALARILDVPESFLRSLRHFSALRSHLDGDETALPTPWAELIRASNHVLYVHGTWMTDLAVRNLAESALRDGTFIAILPASGAPNDSRTDSGRVSNFASRWLAAVDGVLGAIRCLPQCRIRLWLRDPRASIPGLPDCEFVANDQLLLATRADLDSFTIRVRGDAAWTPVEVVLLDLTSTAALSGARLAFDSEWTPDDPRHRHLSDLRRRMARTLLEDHAQGDDAL